MSRIPVVKVEKKTVRTTQRKITIEMQIYSVSERRAIRKARFEASDVVPIRYQDIKEVNKIGEIRTLDYEPIRSYISTLITDYIEREGITSTRYISKDNLGALSRAIQREKGIRDKVNDSFEGVIEENVPKMIDIYEISIESNDEFNNKLLP